MDLTNLQQILIAFVPMLSVLLGFLASCFGVLKQLKKTDINIMAETLKDENSELYKRVENCISLMKQLLDENEFLKKQNNELIGELKRVADYEFKVEPKETEQEE